jgi:hypothetical protein
METILKVGTSQFVLEVTQCLHGCRMKAKGMVYDIQHELER